MDISRELFELQERIKYFERTMQDDCVISGFKDSGVGQKKYAELEELYTEIIDNHKDPGNLEVTKSAILEFLGEWLYCFNNERGVSKSYEFLALLVEDAVLRDESFENIIVVLNEVRKVIE